MGCDAPLCPQNTPVQKRNIDDKLTADVKPLASIAEYAAWNSFVTSMRIRAHEDRILEHQGAIGKREHTS